jgi:hypothetical protein
MHLRARLRQSSRPRTKATVFHVKWLLKRLIPLGFSPKLLDLEQGSNTSMLGKNPRLNGAECASLARESSARIGSCRGGEESHAQ